VLMSSISRVITRHGEAPLGKLALNISGCPPAAAVGPLSPVVSSLHAVLQELLVYSAALPMDVASLNSHVLVPTKDYDSNCITPGMLQLPAGAVVLVDETALAPGQLQPAGVKNMQALTDLAQRQKVAFDFVYFSVDFAADVSLISLSTSKSMLPLDCQVPLRVQPEAQHSPPQLQQSDWLRAARIYMGLAARAQELSLPEGYASQLQEDFVRSRAEKPEITAGDFSRWLTYMRLHAASMLSAEITDEHYRYIKQLERARCERLNARQVSV